MTKRIIFVLSLAVSMFLIGAFIAGCGAGKGSTISGAPVSTPAPPITVSFVSEPQNVTVAAGSQASFSALAEASDGATVSYQWSVNGQSVSGATSDKFSISDATTAMSGSSVTVQADAAGDPAESNPALLLVTPAADPTGNPNPAFVSATPFPLGTYSVTVPTVPVGATLATCFTWSSAAALSEALIKASGVVTDSAGDQFNVLFAFAAEDNSANAPNDVGGYCYGTQSVGGSNISLTINQVSTTNTIFGGVVLVYTGIQGKVDSTSQNNGYLTANGTVASQQYAGNPVPVNLANELLLTFGIATAQPNAAGNGWNSRYVGPACDCSTTQLMVVEDQIGPSTVPNTVTPVFYDPASTGAFETAAASIY